jgi:hypothetical protein
LDPAEATLKNRLFEDLRAGVMVSASALLSTNSTSSMLSGADSSMGATSVASIACIDAADADTEE